MNAVTVEGILTADPALMPPREDERPVCLVDVAIARSGRAQVHGPVIVPVMTDGANALRLIDSAGRGDSVEFVGRLESMELIRDCCGFSRSMWMIATTFTVLNDPF